MPTPCELLGSAEEPVPTTPVAMRYPSWLDARYQLVALNVVATPGVYPGGSVMQIARGNPQRVAIGFAPHRTTATVAIIAPHGRPDEWPFASCTGNGSIWLTIHDYPAIVQGGWWTYSSGGYTYLLTEILQTG